MEELFHLAVRVLRVIGGLLLEFGDLLIPDRDDPKAKRRSRRKGRRSPA